jgi:predicted component of type VI protein secretion system
MSIYGTVIALNLALNSSAAADFKPNTYINQVNQPNQIAIVPLDKYDDGIQESRAEIERLINIVRNHPNLTGKQKAVGVYKLYARRIQGLEENISQGLFGIYMRPEDKDTIVKRWMNERDRLKILANQEIEPYLTARERKVRAMLNDPAYRQRLLEEVKRRSAAEQRARQDADGLRGIIP